MIYAAAACWLAIVVLLARGVQQLWSGITSSRMVDSLLLPGTLVARFGQTLAILVTGGRPMNGGPPRDDARPNPNPAFLATPTIPVFGPLALGALPMAALGAATFVLVWQMSGAVLDKLPPDALGQAWPDGMPEVWEQLRALLTLAEASLDAVRSEGAEPVRMVLFVYLLSSLAIRLAPMPGNMVGHLGAIALVALAAAMIETVRPGTAELIERGWPVLSLVAGWLVFLLLLSLAARAVASTIQSAVRTLS